jgi:hypothetical protein
MRKIAPAIAKILHQCRSTMLMIAKVQSTSDNIDRNNATTMLTTQQSFLIVILQGAMTTTDKCKERT